MAKKSSVQNNLKRAQLVKDLAPKRSRLKKMTLDRTLPLGERFQAQRKLAQMPRNSSKIRIRMRCALTGRARGVYRKFQLSRIMLREMASSGLIPGMVKASW